MNNEYPVAVESEFDQWWESTSNDSHDESMALVIHPKLDMHVKAYIAELADRLTMIKELAGYDEDIPF